MRFQEDGSLKFTSYINNLHPTRYPEIYRAIEKLATKALPLWDQCLAVNAGPGKKTGPGRLDMRLPFEGVDDNVDPGIWSVAFEAMGDMENKPANLKKPNITHNRSENDQDGEESEDIEESEEEEDEDEKEERLRAMWENIRNPIFPDPEFSSVDYESKIGTRLVEKYKDSGLQVIVKMASIKLTPENPEFTGGAWHVEGQMNERIVGTALYYLDSENVTESCLEFRMSTNAVYMNEDLKIGQDAYHWMQWAYGTQLGQGNAPGLQVLWSYQNPAKNTPSILLTPRRQNYGTVETRQGRLLTFPNVFQHRVPAFRLQDSTKPGHRRFIALWLVDPTIRIINTGMVPPQRLDWWLESVLGSPEMVAKLPSDVLKVLKRHSSGNGKGNGGFSQLPPEIVAMIMEHLKLEALPMGEEEAKEHRLKVMEIRSAFEKNVDSAWHHRTYSFCEH
ncbi:hypothetical protein MCOR25_009950 [Pyricularia grisea]|nr:hypothetical protein MCOR25_009950 [Pyricularia grisea]